MWLALAVMVGLVGAVALRVQLDRTRLATAAARTGAQVPEAPQPETGHMRRRRR